jgi:hypothetical protein
MLNRPSPLLATTARGREGHSHPAGKPYRSRQTRGRATAGADDRRHDRARLQGGYAPRLCATCPSIRGLYRPVARHGDSGRPASLPTAPDAERQAAAEHQQRGFGPALLFHSDARPAGPGAPAHRRAVSAADTGQCSASRR